MKAVDFEQKMMAFLTQEVLPHMQPLQQFLFAGGIALNAPRLHEMLRLNGIEDDKGEVNTNKVRTFFNAAFKQVPELFVPGVGTFKMADAEKFIAMLPKEEIAA